MVQLSACKDANAVWGLCFSREGFEAGQLQAVTLYEMAASSN